MYKMFVFSSENTKMIRGFFLILLLGINECWGRLDFDFNRIRILEDEYGPSEKHVNSQSRRSTSEYIMGDDHKTNSLRHHNFNHMPAHIRNYDPKEDPKQFYQSDIYLTEVAKNEAANDVSFLYPGNVISTRKHKKHREKIKALPLRSQSYVGESYDNEVLHENTNLCIKCPFERTLVAKRGLDKVLIQPPRLKTCEGRAAPPDVKFVEVYGPRFGTLLGKGSHVIIGHIVDNDKKLQLCRLSINVVTHAGTCQLPKYLKASCDLLHEVCNITCADKGLELFGRSVMRCNSEQKWNAPLPICKAKSWCKAPEPPLHGHLSCQGAQRDGGLAEGARCRARCSPGLRAVPRAAVCRRGTWTQHLACLPKHKLT